MQNTQTSIDITKSEYLKIRLITKEDEFNSLHSEWDNLIQHSNNKIYQTFEWLSMWWKYYKNEKLDRLLCVLFYQNDKLIGIAPLYVRNKTFLGFKFYSRIYFLGGDTSIGISFGLFFDEGPSDYLDIISLPEYEQAVAKSFVHFFHEKRDSYSEMVLANVRSDSNLYRNVIPELRKSPLLSWKISEADECPYVHTPGSLEDFLKSRTASVRRRFQQSWKEVQEKSLFTLKVVNNTDDLQTAFNEIKRLHQNRWTRLGYPGFFGDPRYEKFFENVLQLFFARGWLWCKTTMVNDKCLAGRLAFKYKGEYYDYLSGIDDQAPEMKRRPGLILLLAMIQDAVTEKALGVDLLRGDEPYKKDFTSDINTNWNIVIKLNREKNLFKLFLVRILLAFKFIDYLFQRERKIFKVNYANKRFPFSIIFFINIRTQALIHKIMVLKKKIKINK